jgi:citrate lyase subunit beta/citryl-CoA lyase
MSAMAKQPSAVAGDTAVRGHGAAGRRGDAIRSDLWVDVDLRAKGGVEIELSSRVEAYYGEAIREQVGAILSAAGVEHARVEIDDKGALPFVIAARVEAALRRSGIEPDTAGLPARDFELRPASPKERMRRSRLYLPGNEPKYLVNAGLHGPDGVILDLEDSVHAEQKEAARVLVRNALACVDFQRAERMVRINQLPLGHEDLQAVVPQQPDMILLPKVESADQVRDVDASISNILGPRADDRPIWLMPILESALGIECAFEIAGACERVAALTLGLEDYAADIGVPRSAEGDESLYARTRVVNAARAAGVQAIDSVYSQVDDTEGLRRWCERSRRLGFRGMGCLHPRQIGVIHEAYNPTAAEIEKALKIVRAFEKAQAAGLAVVSVGSKMIDAPVIKQAQRLVDQARDLGLVPEEEAGRA